MFNIFKAWIKNLSEDKFTMKLLVAIILFMLMIIPAITGFLPFTYLAL